MTKKKGIINAMDEYFNDPIWFLPIEYGYNSTICTLIYTIGPYRYTSGFISVISVRKKRKKKSYQSKITLV